MIFSDNISGVKPSAIREIFKVLGDPTIISLAGGNPDPSTFPEDKMSVIATELLTNNPSAALQYGVTEGYSPLREQLADRMEKKFGIKREGNTVLVVTGGQQGIDLTTKILCNPGDTVICEEPSFIGALNCFRTYGTKLRGIPMEEDGINISELEKALKEEKRAKLIYLIPTFQNPMGVTMSAEKRKKVYELAVKYGVTVLEDNPYGELRFSGEDILPIKALDDKGAVVYCGSFSKVLSPGIRIGFVSAPDEIAKKLVVAKQVTDVHTNIFWQMLISAFLEKYDIDEHISSIKALYKTKCDCITSALDKYIPSNRFWRSSPEGGIFIYCRFFGEDAGELSKKLIEKKVAVVPGTAFQTDENAKTEYVRLNYSMPTCENIERGIKTIGEYLNGKR
jgi:2-aminoadipate transaminase